MTIAGDIGQVDEGNTDDGSGQPLQVQITSPREGQVYEQGDIITFSGSAQDPEDGDLAASALVWTRGNGQTIGMGTTFTTNNLPVGFHVITLTATDSQGNTSQASVSIEVREKINTVSY